MKNETPPIKKRSDKILELMDFIDRMFKYHDKVSDPSYDLKSDPVFKELFDKAKEEINSLKK